VLGQLEEALPSVPGRCLRRLVQKPGSCAVIPCCRKRLVRTLALHNRNASVDRRLATPVRRRFVDPGKRVKDVEVPTNLRADGGASTDRCRGSGGGSLSALLFHWFAVAGKRGACFGRWSVRRHLCHRQKTAHRCRTEVLHPSGRAVGRAVQHRGVCDERAEGLGERL